LYVPDLASGDDEDEEEIEVDASVFPVERYKPLALLRNKPEGEVYLARDKMLDKRVVVKTLYRLDLDQLAIFQEQVKRLNKLEHKLLVDVINFGATSSSAPYMVTEYAGGESLEALITESGAIPVEFVLEIFSQTAHGLSFMHEINILHRELRAENIIVSLNDSSVQVRLLEPQYVRTGYNDHPYDVNSEIRHIGYHLFVALSGKPPFAGDTPFETMKMLAEKELPPLPAPENEIPDELVSVVRKCFAKNASERFKDMGELRDALKRVQASGESNDVTGGGSDSDVSQSNSSTPGSKDRNNANLVVTAVALIALFCVGFVVVPHLPSQVDKSPEGSLPADAPALKVTASSESGEADDDLSFLDSNVSNALTRIRNPKVKATDDGITYIGESISPEQMESLLKPYPKLKQIKIKGADSGKPSISIDEKVLSGLEKVPELDHVHLKNAILNDAALARIASIPKITAVELLECSGFSSEGLAALAKSKTLSFLSLEGSEIDDATIAGLSGSRLNVLIIDRPKSQGITAAGLKHLASLKKGLRFQVLCPTVGSEGETAFYHALSQVKFGTLALRRPNPKELRALLKNKYLSISILDASLDESSASAIAAIKTDYLSLLNCNLESSTLRGLSSSPIIHLELRHCSGPGLSVAELEPLKALQRLETLKIWRSDSSLLRGDNSLNDSFMTQLQKKLPKLTIELEDK
jgi:serine/threonine protein kinase